MSKRRIKLRVLLRLLVLLSLCSAVADAETSLQLENLHQQGQEYYQQGDYAQAALTFAEILTLSPKDKEAKRYYLICKQKIVEAEGGSAPLQQKAEETLGSIDAILVKQAPAAAPAVAHQPQVSLSPEPQTPAGAEGEQVFVFFFLAIVCLCLIFVAGLGLLWYRSKRPEKKQPADQTVEPEAPEAPVYLSKRKLITFNQPKSHISEAYRSLRTSILSLNGDHPPRTVLVTSALPGEGKTAVASNLAITLANVGHKVLLVDSALRHPLINQLFDLDQAPGLSEILTSRLKWPETVNSTEINNLSVITSGRLPPNPSEVLSSARMKELIKALKAEYDFVLFDSPDVIGVTDSAVLGAQLDGTVLVVQSRRTQRETVRRAQGLLEDAKAKVLGCVVTEVNTSIPKWFDQYLTRLEPKL